jgi:hypothetical protein
MAVTKNLKPSAVKRQGDHRLSKASSKRIFNTGTGPCLWGSTSNMPGSIQNFQPLPGPHGSKGGQGHVGEGAGVGSQDGRRPERGRLP